MELKNYQKKVLRDLSGYLTMLNETHNIKNAYTRHWNSQGVRVGLGGVLEYNDTIEGTPHVCFKVPTGGGKTFLACASVKTIFEAMPASKVKVVAWLVPSNAILEQTIRALTNADHPYRQRLEFDFGGRVEVYTKEQLLNGQNFNPTAVLEQLSLCILSYDSLRSNKKDGRKMYQENSQLASFIKHYETPETLIDNVDNTALMQVINQLSPVVIVDESHNAQSDLSVEMLNNLNPSFILDLTATPKSNSNIISYVDARELKMENMVKLPVVVYNRNSTNDVVRDAIQLRGNIERQAIAEEKVTGNFIRPIVLFQAQQKSKATSETFDKLKEELISLGIPAQEIAIKTSEINELKGVDLLSRECPIRYIITVNALKEGWDCPFAYILATLANKTSKIDVEQILGRVLRQPYTIQHGNPLLNTSYVLTCSNDFRTTLDSIVKALNKAGFSRKDFRIGAEVPIELIQTEQSLAEQIELQNKSESSDADEFIDIDFRQIKENLQRIQAKEQKGESDTEIEVMLGEALKQSKEYATALSHNEDSRMLAGELGDKMNHFKIQDTFAEEALALQLPRFYLKIEPNMFFESNMTLLTKEALSDGFTLHDKDTDISFEMSTSDVYKVDIAISGEAVPKYQKVTQSESKYLKEYIDSLPQEGKIKACKDMLYQQLNKMDTIDAREIRAYVNRIVEGMSKDELSELENSIPIYASKIKKKIQSLEDTFREKRFNQMLDSGEIVSQPSYTLPKSISPYDSIDSIAKSLYEAEGNMNNFEHEVITAVASLDNIKWWHRIIERKGFGLNGFINHYPDYMVMTQNGTIVLIETKGDYLANDESKQKLRLGRAWQAQAGQMFRYFMVFKDKDVQLNGAYVVDEFIGMLKKM